MTAAHKLAPETDAGKPLSATSWPRVLVLSDEVPQMVNAGPILLYRLFSGYGQRTRDGSGQVTSAHCAGTKFDTLKNKSGVSLFVIGPRPHQEADLLDCPYRELHMPLRRLETSRFNVQKRSLQACGVVPLPSHRKLMRLLGDFRPEIVVTVMQGTPFMSLAERTAQKLGIPLLLIVHDLNEEFESVFPWARRALFRVNRRVYRSAARRLCVSPEMVDYLEHRYGAPGEVMYPNRSEELQPRAAELSLTLRAAADEETKRLKDERSEGYGARGERQEEGQGDFEKGNFDILKDSLLATSNSPKASAPLTLGYAGSVAYGYGEELVRLIPVLREVGARLRMFSPKPTGILDELNRATDVVEVSGYRPALEAWQEIQETCDAVILPYSNPAGKYELLYRTHFPSKLTEYLALGMPVVVSGPEFATGLKWARGEGREARGQRPEAVDFERDDFDILKIAPNGAVPCMTRYELVACLRRLREDSALRCELAERAVLAGSEDFDPVRIRKVFWRTLKEVSV